MKIKDNGVEQVGIWGVLGIPETKDTSIIKNAYRSKLETTNPEDNQVGFMKLRNAYEEAIDFANQKAVPNTKRALTPTEEFINEVKRVYSSISCRRDVLCWDRLLSRDICTDLDTSDEVKDKLIQFLMDYYRLPHDIWVLLDKKLKLVQCEKELLEQYPSNFINFMINCIQNEGFWDYDLFEGDGDDASDLDRYISEYMKIKEKLDYENIEGIEENFSNIHTLTVTHPYLDIEEMRYFYIKGEVVEVKQILNKLEGGFDKNQYILFYLADMKWKVGDFEDANKDYQKLLTLNPKHYSALVGRGKYCYFKKDYKDSKEHLIQALSLNSNDQEIIKLLTEVNDKIIADLEEGYKAEPDNEEIALEIGWCYYQNSKFDLCKEILDQLEPSKDNRRRYHKLKGRNYLSLGQFDIALKHLYIVEEESTDEEDIYFLYFLIGSAQEGIAEKSDSHSDYQKSFEYFKMANDEAKDIKDKLLYMFRQAHILFKLKSYTECIDLCSHILNMDETYFNALLLRQEAYDCIDYAGAVIEDYFKCIDIYPYYIKPYILAAKNYLIYDQAEDVLEVIKNAEKFGLSSNQLEHYRLNAQRELMSHEEGEEICKAYEQLIKRLDDEDNDIVDMPKVYIDAASTYLQRELEERALSLYEEAEKRCPNSCAVIYEKARYYKRFNNSEKVLELYKKVVKIDSGFRFVSAEIAEIYESRFKDTRNQEDMDNAIHYYSKQLDIRSNDYLYVSRGLLYMNDLQLENAVEDFKKAIELNPDNMWAYNNCGYTYKRMSAYKEAIEMYEKAVEFAEKNKSALPYGNLATLYFIIGEHEKALECYRKNLTLFPNNIGCYDNLAEQLRSMGRFTEAIEVYKRLINEREDIDKGTYYNSIGESYLEWEKLEQAEEYFNKSIAFDPKNDENYERLAYIYKDYKKDYKKALKYIQKAIKLNAGENNLWMIMLHTDAIEICMKLNKKRLANKYLKTVLQECSIDEFLVNKDLLPLINYRVGSLYYAIGDIKKAEYYYGRMENQKKCRSCNYRGCFELVIAKARMAEHAGNIEEAIRYYQKGIDIEVNSNDCKCKIRELQQMQ